MPLLLVEPDSQLRQHISSLLLADGWTVHAEPTGLAGLDWAGRHGLPDGVLVDAFLPDLSTGSFLTRLHALPGGFRVPVILLEAGSRFMPPLEVAAVLVKPFSAPPLLAALQAHVPRP